MYPELFRIGSVTVHSFGVMLALSFVAAGIMGAWQFKRRGVDPNVIYTFIIVAMVGGVLGSKLHYVIVHPDQFTETIFSGRGLIWYGGLILALIGAVVVAYFYKIRLGLMGDVAAPSLAIGYAFGRMGCFLNGDDYGKPTDLPWGMAFPNGDPPTTIAVHPTQLYEVLGSLLILAILLWVLIPRLRRSGAVFWSYLIMAGLARFIVEFWRTNDPVLGLTQQQWISVGLMLAGIGGLVWLQSRKQNHLRLVGGRLAAGRSAGVKSRASIERSRRAERRRAERAGRGANKRSRVK